MFSCKYPGYKLISVFATLLILTTGYLILLPENKQNYSVSWSSGYKMEVLLSEPIIIRDRNDLQKALSAPWYAEMTVLGTKSSKEILLKNCKSYLSLATEKTHPLRENEISAFLELAMMCRSTELLLNAKIPVKSNIPNDFINEFLPEKLPATIAFQTSTAEAKKNAIDRTKKYWSDINQRLKYKAISTEKAKYSGSSGVQTIALVGKGDFNGDGLEDILINSRDVVDGGSYFNLRLFALSVDEEGKWQLIQTFKY